MEDSNKLLELLTFENEKLKEGLMTIQQNLSESVDFNSKTKDIYKDIYSQFEELVKGSNTILDNSRALNHVLKDTMESAREMLSATEDITSFLNNIRSVASQTNLLALNATIEAARAGEAGKGFAVVANEVKELSKQTSKLVENVETALIKIGESSQSVDDKMTQALTQSEENQTVLKNFNDNVSATRQNNQLVVNNVNRNSDRVFVTLAKLDHVIWKINTYLSILKKEPVFKFVDYHNCRLGKWYYEGEGNSNFSHVHSYRSLEQPHSVVHNGTKAILEDLEKGIYNLESFIDSIKTMEDGSEGVFEFLDQILKEKSY